MNHKAGLPLNTIPEVCCNVLLSTKDSEEVKVASSSDELLREALRSLRNELVLIELRLVH